MSSSSLLRIAARAQPSTFFRANGLRSLTPRSSNALYAAPALIATSGSVSSFSTSSVRLSDKDGQEASHHEESFEEFTARYVDPQLASRAFEHLQHSRNEAMMHASIDRQLLTFWCQRIDMRRNSTRSKMSSNFRYDTYCFPLPTTGIAYLQIANYHTIGYSETSTMRSHTISSLHLPSSLLR
jgi:hypothetical protein